LKQLEAANNHKKRKKKQLEAARSSKEAGKKTPRSHVITE